jgi:uncharacterized protein (DUF4415 family)
MDITSLSVSELKALLSQLDNDIKAATPVIKPVPKADNELALCNKIAATFTGKQYNKPVQNAKLIADIQIQKDILDFLNNGGRITTPKRKRITKDFTVLLTNQVSL